MKPTYLISGLVVSFSPLPSVTAEETELLSLYSAVHQSLKQNPEFRGELESIKISQAQIRREIAEFGWGLEALARYEDRSKPQNIREFIAVGGGSYPEMTNGFLWMKT
ncbi:MAG: hypothetical protein ACON4R_10030 [Akkermansiaceae bacterium]